MDDYALSITQKEITAPPMILSQVCSRWREIMHDLPQLWSSISVDLFDLETNVQDLILEFARKSKPCPLQLRIYNNDMRGLLFRTVPTPEGRNAFRALLSHVQQCAALYCFGLEWEDDAVGCSDVAISFPLLRTLDCGASLDKIAANGHWFWDALWKFAPKLEILRVWTIPSADSIPVLLPWPQLTALAIRFQTEISGLCNVLRHCGALETLTIEDFVPEDNEEGDHTPVVLPLLRRLRIAIRTLPYRCIGPLLDTLSLPSLRSLELSFLAVYTPEWPSSLLAMLHETSPTLEELSFRSNSYITSITFPLDEILQLPNLTHLSLEGGVLDNLMPFIPAIFPMLTISPAATSAAGIFVPRLTHLKICLRGGHCIAEDEAQTILSMSESRSRSRLTSLGLDSEVSPLKEIDIDLRWHPYYVGWLQCKAKSLEDWNPFIRNPLRGRVVALEKDGVGFPLLYTRFSPSIEHHRNLR
uniref:F-box domain-containing protein n=1 Tax=Moniliophthora roreri TaxID=221103 RepID=A0A0W0F3Z7_MONRR